MNVDTLHHIQLPTCDSITLATVCKEFYDMLPVLLRRNPVHIPMRKCSELMHHPRWRDGLTMLYLHNASVDAYGHKLLDPSPPHPFHHTLPNLQAVALYMVPVAPGWNVLTQCPRLIHLHMTMLFTQLTYDDDMHVIQDVLTNGISRLKTCILVTSGVAVHFYEIGPPLPKFHVYSESLVDFRIVGNHVSQSIETITAPSLERLTLEESRIVRQLPTLLKTPSLRHLSLMFWRPFEQVIPYMNDVLPSHLDRLTLSLSGRNNDTHGTMFRRLISVEYLELTLSRVPPWLTECIETDFWGLVINKSIEIRILHESCILPVSVRASKKYQIISNDVTFCKNI